MLWRGLAFDRDRLDEPPWLPDVKALLGGVDPARDPVFRPGFGSHSRRHD
jgi:hypothetical protein